MQGELESSNSPFFIGSEFQRLRRSPRGGGPYYRMLKVCTGSGFSKLSREFAWRRSSEPSHELRVDLTPIPLYYDSDHLALKKNCLRFLSIPPHFAPSQARSSWLCLTRTRHGNSGSRETQTPHEHAISSRDRRPACLQKDPLTPWFWWYMITVGVACPQGRGMTYPSARWRFLRVLQKWSG